jgi:translation initiation factor IF-3
VSYQKILFKNLKILQCNLKTKRKTTIIQNVTHTKKIKKMQPSVKTNRFKSRTSVPINYDIQADNVRVVLPSGRQLGIISTKEALKLAKDHNVDLIAIQINAEPPVCRIDDYSKWEYERQKSLKNKTQAPKAKEIQLSVNIADGDLQHKAKSITEFLTDKHPVKLRLKFHGREVAHKELGLEVLHRIINMVGPVASITQRPNLQGRNAFAQLSPAA